ncbi:DUF4363 family protein [Petroclostridium sp. X23]|uniref:DUF4363 family protein n=1 Tax=Petroclostridium sp. X23 TaxID=3045146 RepID=UPI0024AD74FB|nr:DUF4363 family protein [Petroclostridium sp. X23]WHH59468.1 DUF4363 family protein [Petroclostridium sp. X23]
MRKNIILIILIYMFTMVLCSCTILRKPLDRRYEFSKHLKETESFIKKEDWDNAENSLKNSQRAWHKVKPILQVDIDHDYVNDIENNFDLLKASIQTKEKSDALATIYLIQNDWSSIDSM